MRDNEMMKSKVDLWGTRIQSLRYECCKILYLEFKLLSIQFSDKPKLKEVILQVRFINKLPSSPFIFAIE